MKFCPNCGAGVEPGAESCESCGTDLAAVQTTVATSVMPPVATESGAGVTVADLTPRQLRKEIRWGVLQGILLVGVIIFLVYMAIFLFIALAVGGATGVSGISG